MTCGAEECQRKRHARRCQARRMGNRDVTRSHYQDEVVPFREGQPDSQRRWRPTRRLREIREKMNRAGGLLPAGPRVLLRRAEALSAGASQDRQTGV